MSHELHFFVSFVLKYDEYLEYKVCFKSFVKQLFKQKFGRSFSKLDKKLMRILKQIVNVGVHKTTDAENFNK